MKNQMKVQKQAEKLVRKDNKAKAKVEKKLNKKLTGNSEKDIVLVSKLLAKYGIRAAFKLIFTHDDNKELIYRQTLELLENKFIELQGEFLDCEFVF